MIDSIRITRVQGVRHVEIDDLPKFVIIAGPNGAGKSTLLDQLHRLGDARTLYIGPHRDVSSQTVEGQHLLGPIVRIDEMALKTDINNPPGVRIRRGGRTHQDLDEVGAALKHSLAQIAIRRQRIVTELLDQGMLDPESFPDIWKPLRELTEFLLPQLEFFMIETSNLSNVRCMWKIKSNNLVIDFDSLSSGEKALIRLAYPIVEKHIHGVLDGLDTDESRPTMEPAEVILIDEPELHLHPNLQRKLVDYLRHLVSDEGTQVILTSQSSTVVEAADDTELYLMLPQQLVDQDESQLVKVADSEDALLKMSEIFDGPANLTSLMPFLVIEGRQSGTGSSVATDQQIYARLDQRFNSVTMLAGGGKSEVLKVSENIRGALSHLDIEIPVKSMTDADLDFDSSSDDHLSLPVSMVENFLLDPEAIFKALSPVIEEVDFDAPSDVQVALEEIVRDMREHEIERRIKSELGFSVFRPKSPLDSIDAQVSDYTSTVEGEYSATKIDDLKGTAERSVDAIVESHEEFKFFDGKKILNELYNSKLHRTGISKKIFVNSIAEHVSQPWIEEFFDEIFSSLGESEES